MEEEVEFEVERVFPTKQAGAALVLTLYPLVPGPRCFSPDLSESITHCHSL